MRKGKLAQSSKLSLSMTRALHMKKRQTAEEAIGLVRHRKSVLEEHAYRIRAESNITGALNGPQGHVSAKTVKSVQLMEWGTRKTSRHSRRV